MFSFHRTRLSQSGAALLILIMMVVLIGSIALLNSFDPKLKEIHLDQRTRESLSRAKEALIAYAISRYDQNPGVFVGLPCPDTAITLPTSPEGVQEPNCGANNANAVGRLPWRTLNIGSLRDGAGECLWYAVSGHYKTNPSSPLLNEDSPGLLQEYAADGNTLLSPDTSDNRPVAVVFAPGRPLGGQSRNFLAGTECGGNYSPVEFLESVGNAANGDFSNTPYALDGIAQGNEVSESDPNPNNRINDKIITISRQEIWNSIRNRRYPNIAAAGTSPFPADIFTELTRKLAECMANYGWIRGGGDQRLPWAVPVNLGTSSIQRYSDQDNYEDQLNLYGGRFPYSLIATAATLGGDDELFNASSGVGSDPCSQFRNSSIYRNLWNHWKDHIFYVVSEARAPNAPDPSQPCDTVAPNRCLTVNGAGDYAAIIMFAGNPLAGQFRDTAPEPVDNKALTTNYLEGGNAAVLDAENGTGDYVNIPGPNFNDILICIDQNLNVATCP